MTSTRTSAGQVSDEAPWAESTDAGAYYCAHLLWRLQQLPVPRDRLDRPRVGFIHLPDDRGRAPITDAAGHADRFLHLRALLVRALRGAEAELDEVGLSVRVLLVGFGTFADVADNPSGAFAGSSDEVARLAAAAWQEREPSADGPRVEGAILTVDDRALGSEGLVRVVASANPTVVIGLGVARTRKILEVEAVPSDAGLSDDGRTHVRGLPARRRGPANRWLADAIRRGSSRPAP